MSLNDLLWQFQNELGWAFWVPLILLGFCGMRQIWKLDAPSVNRVAQTVRVLWSMGFIVIMFTPIFNGLGPYAFYLMTMGVVLFLKLLNAHIREANAHKTPKNGTVINRIMNTMVDRDAPPPPKVTV